MVCGFTSTRNNRLISARRIVDSRVASCSGLIRARPARRPARSRRLAGQRLEAWRGRRVDGPRRNGAIDATRGHVRMPGRFSQAQHRREADIAAFEQLAPVRARSAGEQRGGWSTNDAIRAACAAMTASMATICHRYWRQSGR